MSIVDAESLRHDIIKTLTTHEINACNCRSTDRESADIQKAFEVVKELAKKHNVILHEIDSVFRTINVGIVIDKEDNISFLGRGSDGRYKCGTIYYILKTLEFANIVKVA